MTEQTYSYLETRWQSQKDYYSKNSRIYKKVHERLELFIMVLSTLIPVLIAIDTSDIPIIQEIGETLGISNILPVSLSIAVAIAAGIERVKKYGDRWRAYRLSSEGLKREKQLYLNLAGPYLRTNDPDRLFVERCEGIISTEVDTYFSESDNESKDDKTTHLVTPQNN